MPSEGLTTVIAMMRDMPDAGSLAERRAGMDELASMVRLGDGVEVQAVEAGGVPAEIVAATGADPDAWILYLHGGGYTAGSVTSHRGHVARLSATCGCQVLNVAYRLAPEHPFPAAVDDAVAAYRWLTGDQGADPGRIVLAGDSAGGGLAAATLVALRDAGEPLPAAAALISPWTDLTMTSATYETRAAADPMCSRVTTASGSRPRAAAAGVDCTLEVTPEAIHVWHLFAEFAPEGAEAVDRLAAWLRPRLKT